MSRVASLALALLVALVAGHVAPATSAAAIAPQSREADGAVDARGRADPTGRWIVVYRDGANVAAADTRAKGRGIAADRRYAHALKGYAAHLTRGQLAAVRQDPDVGFVVPDAILSQQAQNIPRGIRRTEATRNAIAQIDGVDDRVDADVAIVDTGIDKDHEDLNVVGGYNCATSSRTAWGDVNGHGTHVAGTVGALDNGLGVVGVAPGVRLWAVRILDSAGNGLVSWYVCGLDWIAAQREAVPGSTTGETRPVIEVVNMSVAKRGADDGNCGLTSKDVMHQAICRLVASGVTVVAAAGNNSFNASKLIPASYDEVITVSALADMDGKPGGLGGSLCYSWGTYDKDDTYADFSNYGGDVDLIAPGKCTWSTLPGNRYGYVSGTSMAAPHVTGAAALYLQSRPGATPAQVRVALQAAGTYEWNIATDPDGHPDKLLNVAHIVARGDYMVDVTQPQGWVGAAGGSVAIPVRLYRAEDVPDDVALTFVAAGPLVATLSPATLGGLVDTSATLNVNIPAATPTGTYDVLVTATMGDRTRTVRASIRVDGDKPVAVAPSVTVAPLSIFNTTSFAASARWVAATDTTTWITAYQVQWSASGGAWSSATTVDDAIHSSSRTLGVGHEYEVRVRARDAASNVSTWMANDPLSSVLLQDTSSSIQRSSSWWRSRITTMSGGSSLTSGTRGQWFSRMFTGGGIAWVSTLGPTRGKADVYVDGVKVTTVDLNRTSVHYRRVAFTRSWLTSGSHTIKVVVLGTSGHPRVDLDALLVLK